jgi:hypothetical protein
MQRAPPAQPDQRREVLPLEVILPGSSSVDELEGQVANAPALFDLAV